MDLNPTCIAKTFTKSCWKKSVPFIISSKMISDMTQVVAEGISQTVKAIEISTLNPTDFNLTRTLKEVLINLEII